MPRSFSTLGCVLALALVSLVPRSSLRAQAPEHTGTAALLSIDGAIGPATSDYFTRGLKSDVASGAKLIVVQMDTPGGLDSAMREIIQSILASPVPVVTFVYPQGARAASAGTYILYASHVAAMAPATNLGAATPVSIGGPGVSPPSRPSGGDQGGQEGQGQQDNGGQAPEPGSAMERKAVNDAVAYIRSLAERRGRNAEWAERAVRSAASLSAQAALKEHVIDLIAADPMDLLEKLNGRQVEVDGKQMTLETSGLVYQRITPDWRTRLLAVISNPTVAYILMLIGIYGLIFEGYNPGAFVPGVVGAISLLLALFAFQVLPVNYAGLALILLGIVLMIAEFLVPSFGALGLGGIAAFVFGSIILIDSDMPGYGIPLPLITSVATAGAVTLLGILWFAMRSRARPVVSGVEEMLHAKATALGDFQGEGTVWVHGERWRAFSSVPVVKGQALTVTRVDGLTLYVEPAETG
jgi:membrane-bound serine protease (ClpP class)